MIRSKYPDSFVVKMKRTQRSQVSFAFYNKTWKEIKLFTQYSEYITSKCQRIIMLGCKNKAKCKRMIT